MSNGRIPRKNRFIRNVKLAIQTPAPTAEILLVTPVWNDSSRLAGFGGELAQALARSPLDVCWIIADDGSDDGAALKKLAGEFSRIFPHVRIHFAGEHHGKGSVVRSAWGLAPEAAWLAFVDADGSVTPAGVLALLETALSSETSVLGIRKRTASTQVVESPWRSLFHRGFLLAVRLLLGIPCEDPQCGVKVLRGNDYRKIAGTLRENGLAFDSELLLALKRGGSTWLEIPVNWVEKPGGTVKPLRDAWSMLAALLRIRRRFG